LEGDPPPADDAKAAAAADRRDARYPVSLAVNYAARDAFFANQINNLSRGGLFIATGQPLPVQSEIDLTLQLPNERGSIRARGRVVWTFDMRKGSVRVIPGMGIKFTEIAPDDVRLLTDLLESLDKRSC
jgi:type IV pilus assembly protein PilZ